uniref:Uncharacterized protein n=1 Tax=Oryza brachyantha TaxID=4533 RepID=J3LNT3_ORYBR
MAEDCRAYGHELPRRSTLATCYLPPLLIPPTCLYILPHDPIYTSKRIDLNALGSSAQARLRQVDDVHRWLPSEVLRDIGIIEDNPTCAVEGHHLVIVKDLVTRLTGVLLGNTAQGNQHCLGVPLSATGRLDNSYQRLHASPPTEVCPFRSNIGMMVNLATPIVALPCFAPTMWPPPLLVSAGVPPPLFEKWPSGASGTGFFLPRARAYYNRKIRMPKATTRLTGVKPPRYAKRHQRQQ